MPQSGIKNPLKNKGTSSIVLKIKQVHPFPNLGMIPYTTKNKCICNVLVATFVENFSVYSNIETFLKNIIKIDLLYQLL